MSSLEQLYQQVILDHSRGRHGSGQTGHLEHTSHQVNPTCGDEVTLGVRTGSDSYLEELSWEGDGCAISMSSLSMMNDLVAGKSVEEIKSLYKAMDEMMHSRGQGIDEELLDQLEDAAALEGTSKFANRVKCALLGWHALRDAIAKAGYDIAEAD